MTNSEDLIPPPVRERRSGERHSSVLLIGKLVGAAQAACVVHDISANGMMARFATEPVVGETVCVELRGLPPVTGTVRWVRGRKAGVQFAAPLDCSAVFQLNRADGTRARPPRFPISTPARVRIADDAFDAEVVDISAGGAKLLTERGVEPGQSGQVLFPETGTAMFGTICWTREGRLGFRFVSPLPLDTLTGILGRKDPE